MNFIEPITLTAIAQIVWPLCRVSAFFGSMFVISSRNIPSMTKALTCLAITLCMVPSIPDLTPDANPFSITGFIITVKEILIGLALGMVTLFVSQCFIVAGQAIAMQTGLGFASLVDPVSGTNTPVIGQFFTVLCTLVFFSINGHMMFFHLLIRSFETLPIGSFIAPQNVRELAYFGGSMFKAGLAMGMSAICTMLVVNFTLGVMTKAAPQLNVFSLGFAITMIIGIAVLLFSLGSFMGNFTINFNELFEQGCSLINIECGQVL